jgi:aminoglycoside phosphotransferase (APT) family kinase protein
MPRLIAAEDHEHQPLLVIEDLSTDRWPPPWDEQSVARVVAAITDMHSIPGDGLDGHAAAHGAVFDGWETVSRDPRSFLSLGLVDGRWLEKSLPSLLVHERRCDPAGDALTHFDLRSDNMCLAEDRVVIIDWNCACRGNPRLDLGFWLPSLRSEGGPLPERVLSDAPEIAAAVSGFFAARAGEPVIPHAPRVRQVQRAQLIQALPWAIRELGLPQVPGLAA